MSGKGLEQRLVAILAADVAGYSRLMAADERATVAALDAARAVFRHQIESIPGRVIDMAGDSVLAVFETATGAVATALAIQQQLARGCADVPDDRRMRFRIGVHLGDVIEKADGTVYGDGVNIAARLEGLAEPGGITVSESIRTAVKGKVTASFEDQGAQQVKNIAEPIRAYRVVREAAPTPAAGEIDLSLPDKPSIAVLPFDNMSGDAEQAYFSDGITEDIITELSRFRSLFVVARNSSFAFRGKNVDVTEIGRRLGVRYVVDGSVRKAGKRVRVSARLIDATTRHHLWAERYDRELADIFAVQDELTQAIAATLAERLEDADRDRAERKRPVNMTAYDLVLLGTETWRHFRPEDFAAARALFERALVLDPHYARAHANLAWTHVCEIFLETAVDHALDDALRHGITAIALDDNDGWNHGVVGQARFLARQDEESEIEFRRAVEMNPNDADIAAMFANILVYWGRFDEALEWVGKAKRLNPYSPGQYHWYHALALYSCHEYAQAVATIKEMRHLGGWYRGLLAACYAQLGRDEEARLEAELFVDDRKRELERRGETFPQDPLALASVRAARYRKQSDREHFLDGLRKAGLGA
jgi:adenylate cyclase